MRRALVTGGAGFIGSHLVENLLDDGWDVTVLDDLSTGSLKNLAGSVHRPLTIVEGSVADRLAVQEVSQRYEAIFHLAALADIVPSIEEPLRYFEANVTGTLNMVDMAANTGVGRFIYAASSSCYGLPSQFPTPEDVATKPEYPYALTKLLGEQVVMHWGKVYGLRWTSLRLFNVYGPRSRTSGTYGAVMGVFLAQKLAREPLTIVGDGNQKRDFVFVSDVARAFIRAYESDYGEDVFNVGFGEPQSINKLASLIGGPKTYIPRRPGEPDVTHARVDKIKERLQWEPRIGFREGVAEMLNHIDDWSTAPVWNPESIEKATEKWFEYLGDRQ